MSITEIIGGLQFTIDMFLMDSMTGETYSQPRNDMDAITVNSCKAAIDILKFLEKGDSHLFYFDFRFVGGNEAHVYNVEHFSFTHDRRFFKLYLANGCNDLFDMSEIEYIGMGNMEDLDLGVHLPYTLYM